MDVVEKRLSAFVFPARERRGLNPGKFAQLLHIATVELNNELYQLHGNASLKCVLKLLLTRQY